MGNHLDENESFPNKNVDDSAFKTNKNYKSINNINDNNSHLKNPSFLKKKRVISMESNDEDNIIYDIIKINHNIEKITESQINKEKLKKKKQIKENKNKLKSIEIFEQIKKKLKSYLQSSLYKNSEIQDINSDNKRKEIVNKNIKKLMDNYWEDNKEELEPIYQNLNPQNKKTIITELEELENDVISDYLNTYKTIIIPNTKNIENKRNNSDYRISQKKIINKDNNKYEKKENESKKMKEIVDKIYYTKKNEINNNNLNNLNNTQNIKSDIKENDNNSYSFKCLTNNLNFIISRKAKQFIFTMELENNGKKSWPKNKTILSTDLSISNIQMKDIVLEPLKPGLKSSINGIFTDTDKLELGIYYSYLVFKVDGKKYGNNIFINIIVLENEQDIKNEFKTVIKTLTNDYYIPKDIASYTIIGKKLFRYKTVEGVIENLNKSYDK